MFTNTGETTFFMSDTSPPAETITVPGEITFSPLGYFCVIDRESFPVGTLICSAQQKSLNAFTAVYKRASSPSWERHGHIQLADREMLSIPSAMGAHTRLVNASLTDRIEPAAGSASAA